MTYEARETSTHGGQPLELYRIVAGAQRWTLTPHVLPVTYQGEVYAPEPIARTAAEIAPDGSRGEITVSLPASHPIGALWIAGPHEEVTSITIYRQHLSDPDAQIVAWWKGRVAGVRWTQARLELRCQPLTAALKRPGLRARYGLLCRHALYSTGCGAPASAFRASGTVAAVAGSVVTVNAAGARPNGYYTAGMLVAGSVRRLIVAHTGTSLTLQYPAPGLAVGAAVDIYAGCDRTLNTCHNRFVNAANFGGFPWIPQKNPFAGDAIV